MSIGEHPDPLEKREIRSLLIGIGTVFGALFAVAVAFGIYFDRDATANEAMPAGVASGPRATDPDAAAPPPWRADQPEGIPDAPQRPDHSVEPWLDSSTETPPGARAEAAQRVGVRVGIFGEPGNAERMSSRLLNVGFRPFVIETHVNGRSLHYVYAGAFADVAEANAAAEAIRSVGFDVFVEAVVDATPLR